MDRFRIGLAIAALVLVAALAVHALQGSPAAPAGPGVAASDQLIPADERSAAQDFQGIDAWLNSPPLSLPALRGKVVLVDFWTYSCINCIRTIPHLQWLNATYGSRGLLIVGVHSPEFDFEKVPANVARAVGQDGITWPVALDSGMATWNAYQNQYWPAEYLIDQQGRIANAAFGEGRDVETNAAVAALLAAPQPSATQAPVPSGAQTPELYAGSDRGRLADGESYGQPDWTDSDPGPPHDNDAIQLAGAWHDAHEYVESQGDSVVRLRFSAQEVYIVAASSSGTAPVSVTVDGNPVPAAERGADLSASGLSVSGARLYRVLAGQDPGHHLIELRVPRGFRLYTFTFG
jgi:thiol-disulfide isomerase/thioredoxin